MKNQFSPTPVCNEETLMKCLAECDYYTAKVILRNNPTMLSSHPNNPELDMMFARRCIAITSLFYGYKADFKELMDYGFNLDVCDDWGKPLLCSIAQQANGDDKCLDLLKAGARVNICDISGYTPLCYAVMACNDIIVSKLLLYGAVVKKNFCKYLSASHPMKLLMLMHYREQRCCMCNTHDEDTNELSNIPCINRHVGVFFCMQCYDKLGDKAGKKHCPICSRLLDESGLE